MHAYICICRCFIVHTCVAYNYASLSLASQGPLLRHDHSLLEFMLVLLKQHYVQYQVCILRRHLPAAQQILLLELLQDFKALVSELENVQCGGGPLPQIPSSPQDRCLASLPHD
jgi:hypothetical protein